MLVKIDYKDDYNISCGRRLKKNNWSARKFLKKYLKNILKSVDFYQKIWYTVLVRLRGKPQSHLNLPIEEREKYSLHVHNNPPKILHPLNLISPSLKINHSTVQRVSELNSLFG